MMSMNKSLTNLRLIKGALAASESMMATLNQIVVDKAVDQSTYQKKEQAVKRQLDFIIELLEPFFVDQAFEESEKRKVSKWVTEFLIRTDFTLVSFLFPGMSDRLRKYTNYTQKKTRIRMDPKEKKFIELKDSIDPSHHIITIQDKLSKLGLKVGETALRNYLTKYCSR